MVAFLEDDWFAEVAAAEHPWLAPVPDVVVQVDVSGAPGGARAWNLTVAAGSLRSCAAGKADAPDLSLTLPWADAVAIAQGGLDVNAAYMLGRIKTDGPTGPLLALLAGLTSPAGTAARERLAAKTQF